MDKCLKCKNILKEDESFVCRKCFNMMEKKYCLSPLYFCVVCHQPLNEGEQGIHEECKTPKEKDQVSQPSHYTSHPSGIECIEITKHMNFCLGNAIKYIWRAGLKGDCIEDLQKAKKYLDFEIERRNNVQD